MNRRILIQAAAPSMVIGLLLSAACLGSAWQINRLQSSMAGILTNNVTSLRAAQGLEISLRQLRFHCFRYLAAPDPGLLPEIQEAEYQFTVWLNHAKATAEFPEEWAQIKAIEDGFLRYQANFDQQQEQVRLVGPYRDFQKLTDANPVLPVVEPCHELYRLNERVISETSQRNAALSERLHLLLLFLGVGGPVSGLILGYGLARGWIRSIHRLSVQVQDVAQRLDQDVASVRVEADGDIHNLDKQMQYVVGRVEAVVARLQRQQNDMLRAQQLMAVGQLAASVAHEVRNPLTSIKMLVEAALRTHNARPFTTDNLRVVQGEVVRLEKTVQGFLDFARPPELHPAVIDLRRIVARAVELVQTRARQQQVTVANDIPPAPVEAKVDASQLCTVLVNLFLNSLDAMPAGGRLCVSLSTPAGGGIRLVVRDTGTGIAPEIRSRLFTPFASTKPTGTGLGLSISRRIIEEHRGHITAEDDPAGGACFTIALP